MSSDRLVRLPEVIQRTGVSRATIYRKVDQGTFPRPVRLGPNTVAWYESQLDQWIAAPMEWAAAA